MYKHNICALLLLSTTQTNTGYLKEGRVRRCSFQQCVSGFDDDDDDDDDDDGVLLGYIYIDNQ
jgi:hypothetical protein